MHVRNLRGKVDIKKSTAGFKLGPINKEILCTVPMTVRTV